MRTTTKAGGKREGAKAHDGALRAGVVIAGSMEPDWLTRAWLERQDAWQLMEASWGRGLERRAVRLWCCLGPMFDTVETAEDLGLYRMAWLESEPAALRVLPVTRRVFGWDEVKSYFR